MRDTSVFGDLSRIEEMRGNAVKGNLILSRRWYLTEKAPRDALSRVMQHLSPEGRALLERNIMPFTWRPFGLLMEVDSAIVNCVMSGRVENMREFGRELGRHDLSGIYRTFLAVTSPQFAVSKLSALGSMYFRESTLGCEHKSPGVANVKLVGRCMPRYMCEFGIAGWLVAVLEAAKAKQISVEHTHCVHRQERQCVWTCEWLTTSVSKDTNEVQL